MLTDGSDLSTIRQSFETTLFSADKSPQLPTAEGIYLDDPAPDADEALSAFRSLFLSPDQLAEDQRIFEQTFAKDQGYRHGVVTNSLASANLISLLAMMHPETKNRLFAGSEIILSAAAGASTVWPIVQAGLKPVVVDIHPDTLNVAPDLAEAALTPICRALFMSWPLGFSEDAAIAELCESCSLELAGSIRDAEGTRINGSAVGQSSRFVSFDLNGTGIGGGIVVTNDDDLAHRMRLLRGLGFANDPAQSNGPRTAASNSGQSGQFLMPGYDLRPSAVAVAIHARRWSEMPARQEQRRKNSAQIRQALLPLGSYLEVATGDDADAGRGFAIIINQDAPFEASDLAAFFHRSRIETQSIIGSDLISQPAMSGFKNRVSGELVDAASLRRRGFVIGNVWRQAQASAVDDLITDCIARFMKAHSLA